MGVGGGVPIQLAGVQEGILRIACACIRGSVVCHLIKHATLEGRASDPANVWPQLSKGTEERLSGCCGGSNQCIAGDIRDLRRGATNPRPLGVIEEEKFVLENRPAQRKSELVARELRLFDSVGGVEIRVCREGGITAEFVCRPMEVVRSATGSNVHHSTACASVFGGHAIRDHAELLHRVQRNGLRDAGGELIHILATVEQ